MRRRSAVFSMIARHSWSRVLVLLAVLVMANGAAFWLAVKNGFPSIAEALDGNGLVYLFIMIYLLVSFYVGLAMCDKGGRQRYFLNRLRISHRALYMNHWLYNSLCYGVLFLVETLSLLGLCFLAQYRFPEDFNHQSIMLACYQSNLLHMFVPLRDILGWVTNGVVVLSLGACTAALPFQNRNGKNSICVGLMVVSGGFYFLTMSNGNAMYLDYKLIELVASLIQMLVAAFGVLWMEVGEDG